MPLGPTADVLEEGSVDVALPVPKLITELSRIADAEAKLGAAADPKAKEGVVCVAAVAPVPELWAAPD